MKNRYIYFITILTLIVLFVQEKSSGQNANRRSVLNVAQDYIEAMYNADVGRMEEILHTDIVKKGFYWKNKDQQFSEMTSITKAQLIQITKDWNKSDWLPADAPKDVSILDIQEKIAIVKVTAYWGIDYLHISKIDDDWFIIQILSQNWSKKDSAEGEE